MRKAGLFCLVLWGCGEVKGAPAESPDAAVPDAAVPDAPMSPADAEAIGVLDVTTQARAFVASGPAVGAAQAGVDVVSTRRDHSVLASAQTDAAGHASLMIEPGGAITAIYRHAADTGADLVTYVGAQPHDALTFGQRFGSSAATEVGKMKFGYPALAGTITYEVFGPCGSELASTSQLGIELTERASCHRDAMDVVFLALDASNHVLGYNFASVPFQAGTGIKIDSWLTPKTATLQMTGLAAEVESVNAVLSNVGNPDRRMFGFFVNGQSTGGAFSSSFAWAPTAVRTEAQLLMTRPGNFQTMHLLDSLQPTTTSWTVAAPALPPWLQTFEASTADRTGALHLVGTGTYDAAVMQLAWSHGADAAPFTWTFVLPPQVTAFAFPQLPSQFAGDFPAPADDYTVDAHLIEIPAVAGYDALRAIPEKTLLCPGTLVPDCALRNGEFARVIFE